MRSQSALEPGTAVAAVRLIDEWFPCAAVDAAVGTPAGSGRSEKALFTWFASRPIAQARAAVLCTLLPNQVSTRPDVRAAVETGAPAALDRLRTAITAEYPDGRPVVLDLFSGRGIIPLEAARFGAVAVGTDLSPVATLGGRLLGDFPLRDWSHEPPLPFGAATDSSSELVSPDEPRLVADVRAVLAEVDRHSTEAISKFYPRNDLGEFPWAYLWAITIVCDNCRRRFPLVGSMTLRNPYARTEDFGQSLRLLVDGDDWYADVVDGTATQPPTFSAASGTKGKSARCLFCGHVHSLETVKAMGNAGTYEDALLVVAEERGDVRKVFRRPTKLELRAAAMAEPEDYEPFGPFAAVPDELIPAGNQDTVRASGYGYRRFGDLMNRRQTLKFVQLVRSIRHVRQELLGAGVSCEYADALTGYAAANLPRLIRRATRGARILSHGSASGGQQNRVQVSDVFSDESKVSFNFDYIEAGAGSGPGTWSSVGASGLNALKKVVEESRGGKPGRFRRASAVALPFRDATVDAVICDPPYYNMIDYADVSDLFYVWLKRCLFDVFPELFDESGLQDKSEEIVVKRGGGAAEHRTREFYERMLGRAFAEARRVLRPDGHLVVVFGHSDPEAWRRLLGALHDAGFIVTSSWPSRTETASTGVASIKVTVTIGCRVAPTLRPVATAAQVDREVEEAVASAVRGWEADGLALDDQLMASHGPAMEVFGRYSSIMKPDGSQADLDRYVTLARSAVRDATALKLDELPLETFDSATRLAIFWHRLYGRNDVPKGEARFLAQADGLRLEEIRGPLMIESKKGFRLRLDGPPQVRAASSTFEVVRAMAAAWNDGGTESVARVIARAERQPNDPHLWAVVGELVRQLQPSDTVAKALSAVQRNATSIGTLAARVADDEEAAFVEQTLDFVSIEE